MLHLFENVEPLFLDEDEALTAALSFLRSQSSAALPIYSASGSFRNKKLAEAGKRNAAVDQARIQEAHDQMAALGAVCAPADKETKESLRFLETLRTDDSFDSRISALRKAAQEMFAEPPDPNSPYSYSSPYVYVRDCFDDAVVVQVGDSIYQIPYEVNAGGDQDGDDVVLGEPMEVDVAYVAAKDAPDDQTATDGDDIIEARARRANVRMRERNIPQSVRKTLTAGDFAGKGKSFPIVKPADIAAAASSIGRAGSDNYSSDKLKSNIIAIANKKGSAFTAQLPAAWAEAIDSEKVVESAAVAIGGDYVQLREGAVAADGSAQIKLIQPGWGSSGYYSPEVLKRDGRRSLRAA